ncbi:hypothetical protein EQV77_14880 [Halobacillus fulvus]|nr:hypothetical protein EQV77_14880 [Halobacillus fulvus]
MNTLEVWRPPNYVGGEYLNHISVQLSPAGLSFQLENEKHEYEVLFNQIEFGNYVLSFRQLEDMKGTYLWKGTSAAREEFFGTSKSNWHLYKTSQSDYIKWFDTLPGPGSESQSMTHYIIVTTESTFEILSTYEPELIVK